MFYSNKIRNRRSRTFFAFLFMAVLTFACLMPSMPLVKAMSSMSLVKAMPNTNAMFDANYVSTQTDGLNFQEVESLAKAESDPFYSDPYNDLFYWDTWWNWQRDLGGLSVSMDAQYLYLELTCHYVSPWDTAWGQEDWHHVDYYIAIQSPNDTDPQPWYPDYVGVQLDEGKWMWCLALYGPYTSYPSGGRIYYVDYYHSTSFANFGVAVSLITGENGKIKFKIPLSSLCNPAWGGTGSLPYWIGITVATHRDWSMDYPCDVMPNEYTTSSGNKYVKMKGSYKLLLNTIRNSGFEWSRDWIAYLGYYGEGEAKVQDSSVAYAGTYSGMTNSYKPGTGMTAVGYLRQFVSGKVSDVLDMPNSFNLWLMERDRDYNDYAARIDIYTAQGRCLHYWLQFSWRAGYQYDGYINIDLTWIPADQWINVSRNFRQDWISVFGEATLSDDLVMIEFLSLEWADAYGQKINWDEVRLSTLVRRNMYAMLIAGGADRFSNDAALWNDIMFAYDILVDRYGFRDSDIWVLYADGNPPNPNNCPNPGNANPHTNVIDFNATRATLRTVFTKLGNIMGNDDFLYIFTTSHGFEDAACHAYMCLWHEDIRDDEFAGSDYLGKITQYFREAIVMDHCHCGGFIDDLSGGRRVIATACTKAEYSYFCDTEGPYSEFLYYFSSAFNWATPADNPVNAETNYYTRDGIVSMTEAFDWADSQVSTPQTPQYDQSGLWWAFGYSTSLAIYLSPSSYP